MTGTIVLAGLTLWGATGVRRSLLRCRAGIPVGCKPTYTDTQICGFLYLYDSNYLVSLLKPAVFYRTLVVRGDGKYTCSDFTTLAELSFKPYAGSVLGRGEHRRVMKQEVLRVRL